MSKDTGRKYDDGTPIKLYDILGCEDGSWTQVHEHNGKFVVAQTEQDLKNGSTASLGLFIMGSPVKAIEF